MDRQTDRRTRGAWGLLTLNMPRNHLVFWLLMELGWFYLTRAASDTVVTGDLGQPVTLPCQHPSWSPQSNSMCWGKGPCPKSKCKDELAHTDGTQVLSRTSSRYSLLGDISRGDLSLTVSSTRKSDSGVYCCRVEVPGWFNDVKKNIRLQLRRAPVVPRKTTTRQPPTTTINMTRDWTPSMAPLPNTGEPTPHLTTAAPLQTTSCLLGTQSSPPATPTTLAIETTVSLTLATKPAMSSTLATEPATGGATYNSTDAEMPLNPRNMQSPSSATTGAPAMASLSSRAPDPQAWVIPSTPGAATWNVSHVTTFPMPGASETEILLQDQMEVERVQMTDPKDLLMIIVPSLGLLLFVVLLGIFLRGKIMKTVYFQKHSRLEDSRGTKPVLSGLQSGREDEDGLFTL